ncbi:MAG: Putative esterase [Acidimicrobiales bacterium AG-410-I20]|nr:MAG: Putative esterase [Acidimicrobiales bacterium AG-410-I20]
MSDESLSKNTDLNSEYPIGDFFSLENIIEEGQNACRIVINKNHRNPHGVLHGGVTFTLIDQAMGIAAMRALQPNQICTTLEIQVRYLNPVFEGEVEAHASVIKSGKRIIQLEARVTSGSELVAFGTGSFAILDRPKNL